MNLYCVFFVLFVFFVVDRKDSRRLQVLFLNHEEHEEAFRRISLQSSWSNQALVAVPPRG
jgi:hypothetical protein